MLRLRSLRLRLGLARGRLLSSDRPCRGTDTGKGGFSGSAKGEHQGGTKPLDFEARLSICSECPHSAEVVDGYVSFCRQCGCNIQAKAFFEHLHCPINKW